MDSEESGSAYEIPSDEIPSSPEFLPRKRSLSRAISPFNSLSTSSRGSPSKRAKNDTTKLKTENEVLEDAAAWAAKFQAPSGPEDIKTPYRNAARVYPRSKRKPKQDPRKIRAERLNPYYNDEYRLLLNDTIQDVASGMLERDAGPLETSQIGSSIWTADEKNVFFTALGLLGRDDVCGISSKIGSKSEMETRDYILLLDQSVRERHSKNAKLVQSIELPAAVEITDECCAILERAGDAITARLEIASEKIDREKWGDSWLLTSESSRWIEKRIKQQGGEEEIEEVLPAANLLNLPNWLELSREVFMNSGPGYEEDNWTNIAEAGETPAIRATAFEDFHSLTVNITRRIISTVLFCTMSRMRARESHIIKQAEVRLDDVEAAVNILGLKSNSNEFWIKSARRCHLAVIDNEYLEDSDADEEEEEKSIEEAQQLEQEEDVGSSDSEDSDAENEEEDEIHMTYSDLEATLRTTTRRSRSRSRSVSRAPRTTESSHPLPTPLSSPDDYTSRESSPSGYSSTDESSSIRSQSQSRSRSTSREPRSNSPAPNLNPVEKTEALEHAQDAYAEATDIHASAQEEARLWEMLHQTAPFEIDTTPPDELERPKPVPADMESRLWRDHVEYVSSWEALETPVPGEAFARNRSRLSRRGKRKAVVAFRDQEEEDKEDVQESETREGSEDEVGEIGEVEAQEMENLQADYAEDSDSEELEHHEEQKYDEIPQSDEEAEEISSGHQTQPVGNTSLKSQDMIEDCDEYESEDAMEMEIDPKADKDPPSPAESLSHSQSESQSPVPVRGRSHSRSQSHSISVDAHNTHNSDNDNDNDSDIDEHDEDDEEDENEDESEDGMQSQSPPSADWAMRAREEYLNWERERSIDSE